MMALLQRIAVENGLCAAADEAVVERVPGCMTRRTVLTTGLVAATLVRRPAWAKTSATHASVRYVVVDRRYPASLRFGHSRGAVGAIKLEVTDGLTRLWQNALLPLWRDERGAVAGLTRLDTWACISEQARSWHRRCLSLGQHMVADHVVAHRILVQESPPHVAARLQQRGEAWPTIMAAVAQRCAPGGGHVQAASAVDQSQNHSLVSWIIT